MASNEEKADVDVGGWNQDRALAAISAGDTAEGLTATMAEILAAVGEGCFADPGAAAKPIIVAAKAKKNAGVWSVLAAQTFGTLLKALRNAPPPKSPSGSEGGSEEVVVNWEDAYAAGFVSKLPEEFYKGRDGIHFHHTAGFGIVPGKSRGDEGNWNLEGTNGPAICAIWGEDGDTTLSFDSTARYVHFDFVNHEKSRPLKVTYSLQGADVHVDDRTIEPKTSTTVSYSEPCDKIVLSFPKPFGLDNIRFSLQA